ncbi:ABC transporter permease [Micromonospora sonneratiae]|uniref:FtsX-like permease family protein n=1 Tax=Micromonospora sonneratiae TaxID=1184706 RepID=A0ABW3YA32_9ACTN
MLTLSWQTLRARWSAFVGTFVALCLGVCLLATTGLTLASTIGGGPRTPLWYPAADVVVAGTNSVAVTSGSGEDRVTERRVTLASASLPAELPARLAELPGVTGVVVDRRIPVDVEGTAATAAPWSSAGLRPYTLLAGGAPTANDQVVLTGPTDRVPGDHVRLHGPDGARTFTVSGVLTADVPAVYLTDEAAAELAGGRIDAIALVGTGAEPARALAERVRATTTGLRVLTGDARRTAEPNPDSDALAMTASLLGTTAGLAGFVSIFVVAGTFSFAVAQRRREFALLRTSGATPRQVRRLVLGEAMVVGVLASVAGCGLSALTAPPFAHWLAGSGFAPENFTARFILWPLLAAAGVGLLVALLGAWVAARRAARVRPIEALREASVDQRTMTPGRWVFGLLFLVGAAVLLAVMPALGATDGLALILVDAQLALIAAALLAPVLIPVIIRAVAWPLRGCMGTLARSGALTAVRRTAATAAPILVTIGIAASVLAATETLRRAEQTSARDRISATTLAVPAGAAGIADPTVAALGQLPGVRAAVPTRTTEVYVNDGTYPEEFPAMYVGTGVDRVLRLPTVAGSIDDLHGTDTVAVSRSMGWRHGQTVRVWLADGTEVRLRVVAVLADALDLDRTLLLPWQLGAGHGPRTGAEVVYVDGGAAADVALVAGGGGGRVVGVREYLSAGIAEQERTNRLALIAVLGMALLYTGIAIANTLVMATADRSRDLATLRLTGATPGQVLRMIGLEALLVGLVGTVLAGAVAAGMSAGLRAGLADFVSQPQLVVPWAPIGLIVAACLAVTLVASLVPAALAMRTSAARLAGVRD